MRRALSRGAYTRGAEVVVGDKEDEGEENEVYGCGEGLSGVCVS